MTKLLNCPFCDNSIDAEDSECLHPNGIVWTETDGFRVYSSRRDTPEYEGQCYSIHCNVLNGGCGAEISGDSVEEVVEKWNRRVTTLL